MYIETSSNSFGSALDAIFAQKKQYHYVYVSIGSKFNQQDVFFRMSVSDLAKRVDTNTLMQMVPVFLRIKPADQNILVISIDTYHDYHDVKMNRRQIESVLEKNMDCIMINMFCTNDNLRDFCTKLFTKISFHNIHEANCMICNYVKFMNMPNEVEQMSETMIPVAIQSVLERPEFSKYKNCYAEWCGYKYNLYNCIYKVSSIKHDLYLYKRLHDMETFITHTIPLSRLVHDTKLQNLLENSYDISSYHDVDDNNVIARSLWQIYSTD